MAHPHAICCNAQSSDACGAVHVPILSRIPMLGVELQCLALRDGLLCCLRCVVGLEMRVLLCNVFKYLVAFQCLALRCKSWS
eukprot:3364781-Rhodomonas_salina.2